MLRLSLFTASAFTFCINAHSILSIYFDPDIAFTTSLMLSPIAAALSFYEDKDFRFLTPCINAIPILIILSRLWLLDMPVIEYSAISSAGMFGMWAGELLGDKLGTPALERPRYR